MDYKGGRQRHLLEEIAAFVENILTRSAARRVWDMILVLAKSLDVADTIDLIGGVLIVL